MLRKLAVAWCFTPSQPERLYAKEFSKEGEPVWPSGKALGWEAEGPRFDTASVLLSLQKGCGLWTLSCDFVYHFLLKH